jgi:adenylylsulfate kinase
LVAVPAGSVVWFTGLSGAGKTTLCRAVAKELTTKGHRTQILDGDVVRSALWQDLGYSADDRLEHNRRLAYLARLLSRQGVTVLVAAISPLRCMRDLARRSVSSFCEVFVDAPLSICEERDPKGLYRRVRAGDLYNFTGVDAPYEAPQSPEVICCTAKESVTESAGKVLDFLEAGHLRRAVDSEYGADLRSLCDDMKLGR